MRYLYYGIWLSIAISFLCIYSIANAETIDTGNILTNSTFGTGNNTTTTGWSTDGDDGVHSHGAWNGFPYQTGMDDSGGVLAFEGHTEDNVYQDVDLVDDGHLTQQQMNQGFTSTMGADVWFWNSIENTLTLKQTITGSDGSVSTQVREINDHDPNRNFNGGEFTNYTNVHIEGSNTQTDFTIRTELYNETAGTTYDNYHRGPDVDNVTLNITYRDIPPIDDDTQEAIDDIDEDINDIVENIPDDFDWINEDITEIPDFSIPEEEFTIPFDEEFAFDDIYIDELPPIEEFDMEVFEEMPVMEEVFFEEDFSMEPPPAMIEEVFTEEFEEDFTEFLEETGMEEEFMEFLEDEGITAEEFFEEITEEEFDDELTEESFEEFEEPMEEVSTEKESVQETVEDEKETMEEKEVAQDEATEEEEPNSTESEESEVSAENSGEQETIQSEKVDTKDGVVANVRDTENKLKKNLKAIAKQIAKVTKETTQNLTKEDLFFKNNTLDAYNKTEFYKSKDVYVDQNLNLFNQIDLASYSQEIYTTVSLSSYVQNDPVEVHTKKLNDIADKKRKLLIELEALKQ
jgi:hypothetical protein